MRHKPQAVNGRHIPAAALVANYKRMKPIAPMWEGLDTPGPVLDSIRLVPVSVLDFYPRIAK